MMFTLLWCVVFVVIFIIIRNNEQKIRNPQNWEDDIESIDDVTYLIKDDISYVIYKFDSAYSSKYLLNWKFTKISDTEGEIVFGAPAFATTGGGNKDFGHTYNVRLSLKERILFYI